ncbi:Uncharacterised protein [Campylobacter jejuni]|nr:Uncharacterised protein [Campylobacter jejuni]
MRARLTVSGFLLTDNAKSPADASAFLAGLGEFALGDGRPGVKTLVFSALVCGGGLT